ncbi:MAG: hypothetical protein AB8B99_10665 [Phormidesmis sp.]
MAISSVVSNFELLVKPIVQPRADILGVGRTAIQGYFLSIANLSSSDDFRIQLNFRAQNPDLSQAGLLAFWDVNGNNSLQIPTVNTPDSLVYELRIMPRDTGLFILQPNVGDAQVVTDANTEIRGYLEVSLADPFGGQTFNLLLSPEHRGTFLPKGFVVPNNPSVTNPQDFDQLVYSLPTAKGGTEFEFKQISPEFAVAAP